MWICLVFPICIKAEVLSAVTSIEPTLIIGFGEVDGLLTVHLLVVTEVDRNKF